MTTKYKQPNFMLSKMSTKQDPNLHVFIWKHEITTENTHLKYTNFPNKNTKSKKYKDKQFFNIDWVS